MQSKLIIPNQKTPILHDILNDLQAAWWVQQHFFVPMMDDDRRIRLIDKQTGDVTPCVLLLKWNQPFLTSPHKDDILSYFRRAENDDLDWDCGSPCMPAVRIRQRLVEMFGLKLEDRVM